MTVADHHPTIGRSASAFYQEIIDQAVLSEQEGYESFWVAEHHFHEYGIVPAPGAPRPFGSEPVWSCAHFTTLAASPSSTPCSTS